LPDAGHTFLSATGAADPGISEEIFWFLGHPEYQLLIVSAFALLNNLLVPQALRIRSLTVATTYVVSASGVFLLRFTTGALESQPVATAMLSCAPIFVVIASWIRAWPRRSPADTVPMLWAIGSLSVALIGIASGALIATQSIDTVLQETYYVVAHYHYLLRVALLFTVFGAFYVWLPRLTGLQSNAVLARVHFWLSFAGVNLAFLPQHIVGLAGMPRRYADYPDIYADWNTISSIGAFLAGVGMLVFLAVLVEAFARRRRTA